MDHQFWQYVELSQDSCKNLEARLLFVDFSKEFEFIHRGKMEQILLVYGLPKETVTAIRIFFRNTNVKVRSLDYDRRFRHCCWSFARGYISNIYVYNLLRLYSSNVECSNEKWLYGKKKKKRNKRYPAETITDSDCADDIELLRIYLPKLNLYCIT